MALNTTFASLNLSRSRNSSAKITSTSWATWKFGGVFTPLDYHVPREVFERMLSIIATTCVLAPSTESVLQNFLKRENFSFDMLATNKSLLDVSLLCLPFNLKNTTDTTLSQRYLELTFLFLFPCSHSCYTISTCLLLRFLRLSVFPCLTKTSSTHHHRFSISLFLIQEILASTG